MKIEEAINQQKFSSPAQKVSINLLYTASWLISEIQHMLRPHGITMQQYNIMRILRGQKGNPVSLKLVSSRMIDRMSNTSRLVDKLVQKGLVRRAVAECDRRQLAIILTDAGTAHLKITSSEMEIMSSSVFNHLNDEKLEMLNEFLNEIRETN